MGIDGLLALLKPLIKKQHISSFRQKTLAVDALPWIYKGVYGANLQMGEGISENSFLYYIMQMIDMLQFYKIRPIFVFDGKSLEAKYKTLDKRKKAKQDNKMKANLHMQNNQAEKCKKTMARCINIDEAKLSLVMRLLNQRKIEYVVAPYQADSQISKLYKLGLIDSVITQDSDLVIYGVDVILKLKQTGQCDYLSLKIQKEEIAEQQCPFLRKFYNFAHQKRIQTAILAGCDYVDSVKGIGIKKAIKLVQQNQSMQKIVEILKKDLKLGDKVPQGYLQLIQNSKLIFLFAKVFNPSKKQLQCLSSDLQNQISHHQIQTSEFQNIVGKDYEFNESHYKGIVNCKTQTQRIFQKLDLTQIYYMNRQNINFDLIGRNSKGQDSKIIQKQEIKIREAIIDQTTSICWQTDSCNEGLVFLLQKQLVAEFFMRGQSGQNQQNKKEVSHSIAE